MISRISLSLAVASLVAGCSSDGTPRTTGASQSSSTGSSEGGAGGNPTSTSQSVTSALSSGSTGGSGGNGGAPPTDPCFAMTPTCPNSAPTAPGGGLVAIDHCAFPMNDTGTWATNAALLASLEGPLHQVPLGDILLADLDRTATSATEASVPGTFTGFAKAFQWENTEENEIFWVPEGLTGSAEGSDDGSIAGKKVLAVSFRYISALDPNTTGEKGVRIAFVDTTIPNDIHYRFALLVEPKAGNPVDFDPVKIDPTGLAWYGDNLYVTDPQKGFRVFDVGHMFRVATDKDSVGYDAQTAQYYGAGYEYVLPQVGAYESASTCATSYSFLSVDRSTNPPSLVTGENCNGISTCQSALDGRLFRFPLDTTSRRLAGASELWPSDAFYSGETQLTGAASFNGRYFLSSTAPQGGHGALYVLPPMGQRQAYGFTDSPGDLLLDPVFFRLWGLSKAQNARFVMSVYTTAYP